LKDPAITSNLIGKRTTFGYRQRQRLLTVNVLAGSNRGDGRGDMPMVRRGNRDRIDIIASQQVTEIIVAGLRVKLCGFPSLLAMSGIDITYGHNLAAGLAFESFHISCALTSHTDTAHRDALTRSIRPEYRRWYNRRHRQRRPCRNRTL
jgi:hypothetical protein